MAYAFNGTNQSLSVSRPSTISVEPVTIAAWFKNNRNTNTEGVIGIYSTTNDSFLANLFCAGTAANDPFAAAKYVVGGSNPYGESSIVGFVTGSWQQGSGAFGSTTSRTVYLNGSAGTTNTTLAGAVTTALIRIAASSNTTANSITHYLSGDIAEAAIWSAALNAGEIASLSKGFKPTRIRPQSLVFYAPLVRNLQDVKGGLTLTNNNSATVADHPRVY